MIASSREFQRSGQFGLRSIFLAISFCAAGFGFLRWYGPGAESAIILALLAAIPGSIAVEHLVSVRVAGKRASIREIAAGSLSLMLLSTIPLGVATVWWFFLANKCDWIPMIDFIVACTMVFGNSWLSWFAALLVPVLTFVVLHTYLATDSSPLPIRLRVPILMALFSMLCAGYVAFDWGSAVTRLPVQVVLIVLSMNVVIMAAIWCFWLRVRHRAQRYQAAALAVALHCWLFGLAFPCVGGTLIDTFFHLDLTGLWQGGRAPEVDLDGWSKMKTGLTEQQVIELLGGMGHASGGGTIQLNNGPPIEIPKTWEYNWHGGGSFMDSVEDRAYVVWFDSQGSVTSFREPKESAPSQDTNSDEVNAATVSESPE
jgi:hypothetical protein